MSHLKEERKAIKQEEREEKLRIQYKKELDNLRDKLSKMSKDELKEVLAKTKKQIRLSSAKLKDVEEQIDKLEEYDADSVGHYIEKIIEYLLMGAAIGLVVGAGTDALQAGDQTMLTVVTTIFSLMSSGFSMLKMHLCDELDRLPSFSELINLLTLRQKDAKAEKLQREIDKQEDIENIISEL